VAGEERHTVAGPGRRWRGHGERHDLIALVEGNGKYSARPVEDPGDDGAGVFQGRHIGIAVAGGGCFRPYPRRTADMAVVAPQDRRHDAGRGRTKPPSIFPTSMVPVPVVTTGSPAAKARTSSSSSASTTPRPHEPLPSSTGPKITIWPDSIQGRQ